MDKLEMTPEQQLAFDGFIDVMVQIYKMTQTFLMVMSIMIKGFIMVMD